MAQEKTLPNVVLVGRTNVGKSSLFNRLAESTQALVSPVAGTTRDLNKGEVEWEGLRFHLIDTGGIDLSKPDEIEQQVLKQAWDVVRQADAVFLVTDTKVGIAPGDESIAQQLRSEQIPFSVIANKADSPNLREDANEFYTLAPDVFALSAANGTGTADFLDDVVHRLGLKKASKKKEQDSDDEKTVDILATPSFSVALVGLPNVGKSSLLNSLLGRDEVIVSAMPHTTRETRDTIFSYEGSVMKLVDTAGLRKVSKMRASLQKRSAKYSHRAIEQADWAIFVIDASQQKWGEQERYLLQTVLKSGTSVVIAANKWDLLEDEDRYEAFKERWMQSMGTYDWIPVIPVCAKTGRHVHRLLDTILDLNENRLRELPQSALDRLLKNAIKRRRPQKKKGPEAPYIHTIKQVATAPPTFEIVIKHKDTLAESYIRFLEKQLRQKFDFEATPIRIYVRSTQTV